jgi:molybdenum cofactor synthesis domain-containing protein
MEKSHRLDGARAAIVVASDSGARGERADTSGGWLAERLRLLGADVLDCRVVPDDVDSLRQALVACCDELGADLVFTCGGTGFTQRDVTPEATLCVVERLVPGIPEAMRAASLSITPMAMLSRGVAGIRGKSLILNLPGSPKAVQENVEVVLPILPHAVETLRSYTGVNCAR